MGNVINIEQAIEKKYSPQYIMDNRPSDDGLEIIAWLETFGIQKHLARRCYDTFFRSCMAQAFGGVELVFKPALQAVSEPK